MVEAFEGNAYRAIYTVRFEAAVYVLHAFQKKSPSGIRTSASDVKLVEQRLRRAQRIASRFMASDEIERGSGNVFADLGLPDAGDRQTKTRLAMELNELIKTRRLKQIETAALLGIPQPKVSALVNYRLDGFSVERLMEFLTAFDRDVEILVRPAAAGKGRVSVHAVR